MERRREKKEGDSLVMDADQAKPQMAWVHQVHSHTIISFYWIEGVFHKPRYSAATYLGMYIATV